MKQADPLLERLRALRDETACDAAHDRVRAARAEAAFLATATGAPLARRPSLMLPALAAWMVLYVISGAVELQRVFGHGASDLTRSNQLADGTLRPGRALVVPIGELDRR